MDKIAFIDPETKEEVKFYVLEQTRFHGYNYLLVTETEEEEADAYILKDISDEEEEEASYMSVEDPNELQAVAQIFEELLEDIDLI